MINNQTCGYDGCEKEIWSNSNNRCIFHEKSNQKAEEFVEAFRQIVKEIKIAGKESPYSFVGYYFPPNININDIIHDIIGLSLDKDVDFSHAKLYCDVDFSLIEFQQDAIFFHTEFHGSANFNQAVFCNEAQFIGAKFYNYAAFVGNDIFHEGANFRESQFSGIGAVFNTDVSNISFIDAILHDVDFTGSTWDNQKKRILCRDEADAQRTADYEKAEAVCRNIKQCYHRAGDYDKAGEFYYGEMECKRNQKEGLSKPRKFFLHLLRHSCGYGERPWFAVRSALEIVVSCALLYFFFAGIDNCSKSLLHLWHCFYFSIVTFTTLGFGDYEPLTGFSQLVAAVEAFSGIIITALFILTFGRKMMR